MGNDRVIRLNGFRHQNNVLYLMRRDKRIQDNYCVECGYILSYHTKTKFFIGIEFSKLVLNERQKTFVVEALQEAEQVCRGFNIYFDLIQDLESYVSEKNIDCIILDFSPLRQCLEYEAQVERFCKEKQICLYSCDAHNMVPCKLLSTYKKSGRAVKADLFRYWSKFLQDFRGLKEHKYNKRPQTSKQKNIFPAKPVQNIYRGGYSTGMEMVEDFFKNRFHIFHKQRNNANVDAQSHLGPWLSMGLISGQRVILMATRRFNHTSQNLWTFINEVFVWKETAEHFCFHEPNYDSLHGALPWARSTLLAHAKDERERVYNLDTLIKAKTDSKMWNAAQTEMMLTGKMHLYCRMFWAKQLLQWTRGPDKAVRIACKLNDSFSLDGNSPTGYLAIMWAMCGTMDQGFRERPIFGKVRPMNEIKAPGYVKRWTSVALSDATS